MELVGEAGAAEVAAAAVVVQAEEAEVASWVGGDSAWSVGPVRKAAPWAAAQVMQT